MHMVALFRQQPGFGVRVLIIHIQSNITFFFIQR